MSFQNDGRYDIKPSSKLQIRKPHRFAGDAGVCIVVSRHPAGQLIGPADIPREIDAPGVVVRVEGKRLEGNGHFRRPATVFLRGGGAPDPAPVPVGTRRVLVNGFHAHAIRIHLEAIAVTLVVERIDDQRKEIVTPELPALSQNGADHLKGLGHACAHVERVVVVEDQDARGVRRGLVFERFYLVKVIDDGRVFPDCLIQPAVDHRRRIRQATHLHGLHGRPGRLLAQGCAALDEDA